MTLIQGLGCDRDAQIWCITLELYVMDGLHQQAACDVALMRGELLHVQITGEVSDFSEHAGQEGLTEMLDINR